MNIVDNIKNAIYLRTQAGKELNRLAKNICSVLEKQLNSPIKFNFNYIIPSYLGGTSNLWNSDEVAIYCGASDFAIQEFDDQFYTNSVITIFHEAQHVQQLIDIKEGTADERILYAHLAKHDSAFYLRNYSLFYDELDAERVGILNAYQYISENHSEIDVMACIKNYMKQKGGIYDKHETDIDNLSKYDDIKRFFDSIEKWLEKQLKTADIPEPDSPFKQFLRQLDQNLAYTSGWSLYIANCDNNIDCDKFVSYIILQQYPEYILNYPQKQQQILNQLQELVTIEETKEEREI